MTRLLLPFIVVGVARGQAARRQNWIQHYLPENRVRNCFMMCTNTRFSATALQVFSF
jgi:hypothetical protein